MNSLSTMISVAVLLLTAQFRSGLCLVPRPSPLLTVVPRSRATFVHDVDVPSSPSQRTQGPHTTALRMTDIGPGLVVAADGDMISSILLTAFAGFGIGLSHATFFAPESKDNNKALLQDENSEDSANNGPLTSPFKLPAAAASSASDGDNRDERGMDRITQLWWQGTRYKAEDSDPASSSVSSSPEPAMPFAGTRLDNSLSSGVAQPSQVTLLSSVKAQAATPASSRTFANSQPGLAPLAPSGPGAPLAPRPSFVGGGSPTPAGSVQGSLGRGFGKPASYGPSEQWFLSPQPAVSSAGSSSVRSLGFKERVPLKVAFQLPAFIEESGVDRETNSFTNQTTRVGTAQNELPNLKDALNFIDSLQGNTSNSQQDKNQVERLKAELSLSSDELQRALLEKESLSNKLSVLSEAYLDLEGKEAASSAEVQRLSALSPAEQTVAALQAECGQLREELKASLQEQLRLLREAEGLNVSLALSKSELRRAILEQESLSTKLSNLTKAYSDLESKQVTASAEIEQTIATLQAECGQLRDELKASLQEQLRLVREVEQKNRETTVSEIDNLRRANSDLVSQVEAMRTEKKNLEETLQRLELDRDSLPTQLPKSQANNQSDELAPEVESQGGTFNRSSDSHLNGTAEVTDARQDIRSNNNASVEQELLRLGEVCRVKDASIDELTVKLQQQTERLAMSDRNITTYLEEADRLKNTLQRKEKELQESLDFFNRLEERCVKLESASDLAKSQAEEVAALKRQVESLSKDLQSTRSLLASREVEVNRLTVEIKAKAQSPATPSAAPVAPDSSMLTALDPGSQLQGISSLEGLGGGTRVNVSSNASTTSQPPGTIGSPSLQILSRTDGPTQMVPPFSTPTNQSYPFVFSRSPGAASFSAPITPSYPDTPAPGTAPSDSSPPFSPFTTQTPPDPYSFSSGTAPAAGPSPAVSPWTSGIPPDPYPLTYSAASAPAQSPVVSALTTETPPDPFRFPYGTAPAPAPPSSFSPSTTETPPDPFRFPYGTAPAPATSSTFSPLTTETPPDPFRFPYGTAPAPATSSTFSPLTTETPPDPFRFPYGTAPAPATSSTFSPLTTETPPDPYPFSYGTAPAPAPSSTFSPRTTAFPPDPYPFSYSTAPAPVSSFASVVPSPSLFSDSPQVGSASSDVAAPFSPIPAEPPRSPTQDGSYLDALERDRNAIKSDSPNKTWLPFGETSDLSARDGRLPPPPPPFSTPLAQSTPSSLPAAASFYAPVTPSPSSFSDSTLPSRGPSPSVSSAPFSPLPDVTRPSPGSSYLDSLGGSSSAMRASSDAPNKAWLPFGKRKFARWPSSSYAPTRTRRWGPRQ